MTNIDKLEIATVAMEYTTKKFKDGRSHLMGNRHPRFLWLLLLRWHIVLTKWLEIINENEKRNRRKIEET